MNTHQWYQMGLRSIQPPNTFIGGVSATISTASALATKLGISVGRIENFTIEGSDIKCKITGGNYVISQFDQFFDTSGIITYYRDLDGLVSGLGNLAFYNTTIAEVYTPNATSIGTAAFDQNIALSNNLKILYAPRCTSIGDTVLNNNVFRSGNLGGGKIYVDPSLQTINSGGVEGDIAYLATGNTINYVTNFTAPNPVTTLSAGTIYNTAVQLNFTAPSSTNAIEYYELSLNGVLQTQRITASGQYITGLTPSTSYNITLIAVDIFYNKSVVSNSLSVTTNTTETVPTTGLISYYKLDETITGDAVDVVSAQNLTNTAVTINQSGKVGTSYLSNASSQKLQSNLATPIVGNFSLNAWIYKTAGNTDDALIFQQGNNSSIGFGLYLWSDTRFYIRINSTIHTSNYYVPLNTWINVSVVYNGSNIKIYINSTLQQTITNTTNPTSSTIRSLFYGTSQFYGKIDEVAIYNTALTQTEIDLLYNSGSGITL